MNDKLYWNRRYASGGNSGSGSRGKLVDFKAEVINSLIKEYNVLSLLDLGCGDGYQLKEYKVPLYYGYDISEEAIKLCEHQYKDDITKIFGIYGLHPLPIVDMAISMDVLFHITDTKLLEDYLNDLFGAANKIVVIYAYDYNASDKDKFSSHYQPVSFTPIIKNQHPEWTLVKSIKNIFPVKLYGASNGSYSDFYVWKLDI